MPAQEEENVVCESHEVTILIVELSSVGSSIAPVTRKADWKYELNAILSWVLD
jgi:hypothetical protein